MRVDQLTEHLPAEEIERPKAWTRDTISADRWLIPLPEACIAELDQVVMSLRVAPRPVESLAPAAFSLRACSDLMSDVRAKLETDTGLAVVDSPVSRHAIGLLSESHTLRRYAEESEQRRRELIGET